MRIFTGRQALTGAMVAFGLLVGTAASGWAAGGTGGTGGTGSTTTPRVTFGSAGLTSTSVQRCDTGRSACASSDPRVSLAWSSTAGTAGCSFRLVIDWGDGSGPQTVKLTGSASAKTWPVRHTYAAAVAARHAFPITATGVVVKDTKALGCGIDSAAVTFTSLCTPTQLSGPAWSARFPGGDRDVNHLNAAFRKKVTPFITAMTDAGLTVQPQSTLRSPQRSYLMHFSYLVSKRLLAPQAVPAYVPVAGESAPAVCWLHRHKSGNNDTPDSVAAARGLLQALGVDPSLGTPPALRSRHNTGDAIDMKVSWTSSVKIRNAAGKTVKITTGPRDAANPDLIAVGLTYGVHHLSPAWIDRNHWSSDGH